MKSTYHKRLGLLGVTTMVMIGLALLQPKIGYSQFDSPMPTPSATPIAGVIDLTVDKNLDGVPDQLLTALQAYEVVVEQVNRIGDISNNPEAQAMLQRAQEAFERQMPYSATTRKNQAQLGALNQALFEATDQETREKLWHEIETLQSQMLQDPSFALVAQIVNRRLTDAMNAKIAADLASEKTPTPQPTATPTDSIGLKSDENEAPIMDTSRANNGGLQTFQAVIWIRSFPRDGCNSSSAPNFGSLTRGELMFYAGDNKINNFFYAKKFSHVGIYDGVIGGSQRVYESNPSGPVYLGGARREFLDTGWKNTGGCVAFATVNGTTATQRQSALDWAETTYGINGQTPYNYNFLDKDTNSALYCSQLPWKMFMHLGIDLDSDSSVYSSWLIIRFSSIAYGFPAATAADFMVAPDEIALSSSTIFYQEGTNP